MQAQLELSQKNASLKDMVTELQEDLKDAREQKAELSGLMDKLISEKKALEYKLHEAGKDRDEYKRLRDNAKRKEDDWRSQISDLVRDKEHLQA